jgi:hypothetical protein
MKRSLEMNGVMSVTEENIEILLLVYCLHLRTDMASTSD